MRFQAIHLCVLCAAVPFGPGCSDGNGTSEDGIEDMLDPTGEDAATDPWPEDLAGEDTLEDDECVPTTCAAEGKNCGTISNGCTGTLECGTCMAPETCGGGGVDNVCGGEEPVISCTTGRIFGAGDTLDDVQAAVSGAAAGDVICLERGAVFSGDSGLVIDTTAGTAEQPVVICSSTGTDCASSGGDNARLRISGEFGMRIGPGVSYVRIRDIDLEGSGNEDSIGLEFFYFEDTPPSYVTVEGGLCSNWGVCWMSNPWANTSPPTHVSLGTCPRPWTIRHTTGFAGGGYGYFQDSVLAMDMADTGADGIFSHNIYFSTGPYAGEVSGVVVECSRFTDSGLEGTTSMGLHLKVSGHVADITVRDSLFEDDDCNTYTIGVGTSNDDLAEDYASVKVYRTTFRTDCVHDVYCDCCYDSEFYNNVFYRYPELQNNAGSFMTFSDSLAGRARYGHNRIFNNTFADLTGSDWSGALVSFGSLQLDDNEMFNNLFYVTGEPVAVASDDCARFGGTGGPDFDSNFVYTPDDASPFMPDCTEGTGNSTVFSVDPGLADASSGDFSITSESAVYGLGRSEGAPETDFTGAPRPDPPSIGAFDVAPAD